MSSRRSGFQPNSNGLPDNSSGSGDLVSIDTALNPESWSDFHPHTGGAPNQPNTGQAREWITKGSQLNPDRRTIQLLVGPEEALKYIGRGDTAPSVTCSRNQASRRRASSLGTTAPSIRCHLTPEDVECNKVFQKRAYKELLQFCGDHMKEHELK